VRTRLDDRLLREVRELTNGSYHQSTAGTPPLAAVFHGCIEGREVREESDDALPLYRQRYPWFLGAALVFLVGEAALGLLSCVYGWIAPGRPSCSW
jgi:hypothetical protein